MHNTPSPAWEEISDCRICGSTEFSDVVDFGAQPIADKLQARPDSTAAAPRIPLRVIQCSTCSLSQLSVNVSPRYLYDATYPYFSSVSPALSRHFEASARDIIKRYGIGTGNVVIEAASNDGYMLQHFKDVGATVLGFDPSEGPASVARGKGISTRIEFFDLAAASTLMGEGLKADVFLANNVLAHVPDTCGFVRAIATVLKPDGRAILEVPYFVDLVQGIEFDTIYHQHLCYFTVTSLARLCDRAGLRLDSVQRLDIHGGSLRLVLTHGSGTGASAKNLVDAENANGWSGLDFARRVECDAQNLRTELVDLIRRLKSEGFRTAAYGAAAKASTMLAWCGLDVQDLEFVSDLNRRKHGKFMPGTDLLICPADRIATEQPDFVLILAWNFADEIMAQLEDYRRAGGRFIIPVPSVRIVE